MYLVLPACSNSNVLSTLSFIKTVVNFMLYLIPSVLILVLGFKLFKIVTSSDPDLKKGMIDIIGKIAICVTIFFVPTLVALLTEILAESGVGVAKDYSYCLDSANKDNIAFYKEKEESKALLEQEKVKAEKKKTDEERKAISVTREKAREENEKREDEAKKKAEEEKRKRRQQQQQGNNDPINSGNNQIEGTARKLGDVVWNPNDVTEISNITSTQLAQIMNIKGSGNKNFIPYAVDFVTAENKYHINAFFLVALNGFESGWFTGEIARGCNNIGSVCEHSGHPSNGCGCNYVCCFAYFNSVGDSIDYTSSMLKKNYLTSGGRYYEGLSVEKVYTIHYCPGCNNGAKQITNIANSYFDHVKDVLNP